MEINVRDYGAKVDGRIVADGAIVNGSTTLACTTSTPFRSKDVGKLIQVNRAGAAGANLVTTITSFVDSGHVVLALAASRTVSGAEVTFGTDDAPALQSALNAVPAGGATLIVPNGIACLGSGLVFQQNGTRLVSESSNFSYGSTVQIGAPPGDTRLVWLANTTTAISLMTVPLDSNTRLFGCELVGLFLDGGAQVINSAVGFPNAQTGVMISAVHRVSGCIIQGFNTGIRFFGLANAVLVENCTISNNQDGLTYLSEGTDPQGVQDLQIITVRNCRIRENWGYGVNMIDAQLCNFEACNIESNNNYGLYVHPGMGDNINNICFERCWWDNNGQTNEASDQYHVRITSLVSPPVSLGAPRQICFEECLFAHALGCNRRLAKIDHCENVGWFRCNARGVGDEQNYYSIHSSAWYTMFWDSDNREQINPQTPTQLVAMGSRTQWVGRDIKRDGTGSGIRITHGPTTYNDPVTINAAFTQSGGAAVSLGGKTTISANQVLNGTLGINIDPPDTDLHLRHNQAAALTAIKVDNQNAAAGTQAGLQLQIASATWTIAAERDSERLRFIHGSDANDAIVVDEGQPGFPKIGINGPPANDSYLAINGTLGGVVLPCLTTAQRNAIVGQPEGLLLYNTDTHLFNFWNGTAWRALTDQPA